MQWNTVHRNWDYASQAVMNTGLELDAKVSYKHIDSIGITVVQANSGN